MSEDRELEAGEPHLAAWTDALSAAALFAIDPAGMGGIVVKDRPGGVRDHWLVLLRMLWPEPALFRRLPLGIADDRLIGGLDLAATLAAGRPVAQRGLLSELDGGILVIPSAERLTSLAAARLTAVIDTGIVSLERDGLARRDASRFGIIALDESVEDDERLAAGLGDRLAFRIDLVGLSARDTATASPFDNAEIVAARTRLPAVKVDAAQIEALCSAAIALGIDSPRAPILALKVARAAAALGARDAVTTDDLAIASRLVLGPRATTIPATDQDEEQFPDPPPPEPPDDDEQNQPEPEAKSPDKALEEIVLAAAKAVLPPELIARLTAGAASSHTRTSGRSESTTRSMRRGRPIGARPGEPRCGARLDIIATLRAAAPWQKLRSRGHAAGHKRRIEVRRSDLHVTHFEQRTERTTIFVVDASGSAALNRLAEAKGAVELLLADCYVRRDQVALLAFRRTSAELLLPPTRSLVRAKRSLAALPGGGGTPMAMGIDAALELAVSLRRRGQNPVLVLLTDGRANIARDGSPGRPKAELDSIAASQAVREARITALLFDTAPRAEPAAKRIADAMGATYIALPHAAATEISSVVRAAVDAR